MNVKVALAKTGELAKMAKTCISVHVLLDLPDKIVKQVTVDKDAGEVIV